MEGDVAQNAMYLAASGVLGALISQGFGYARHRSEAGDKAAREREAAQSLRFDNLLKDFGAQAAKVEMMSGKIGKLEGKVESLEKHRDELTIQLAEALEAKAKLEAELEKSRGEVGRLNGSNAELLMDLEVVQKRVNDLEGELAALKAA